MWQLPLLLLLASRASSEPDGETMGRVGQLSSELEVQLRNCLDGKILSSAGQKPQSPPPTGPSESAATRVGENPQATVEGTRHEEVPGLQAGGTPPGTIQPQQPAYHMLLLISTMGEDRYEAGIPDAFVDIVAHQLNFSALMLPASSVVHVLVVNQKAQERMRALAAQAPSSKVSVRVEDVSGIMKRVDAAFMSRYIHQSTTRKALEGFDFFRWGVLSDYVQSLGLDPNNTRVFAMDADVFATWPIREWLPTSWEAVFGTALRMVVFSPGACVVFTPGELKAFWYYLMGLYLSPTDLKKCIIHNSLLRPVSKYGSADLIPVKQGEQVQYHFSDMLAMNCFELQNPDARKSVIWLNVIGLGFERTPPTSNHLFVWKDYRCSHMYTPRPLVDANWTLVVNGTQRDASGVLGPSSRRVYVPDVPLPLCYMHFQGGSKKHYKDFNTFFWTGGNGTKLWFSRWPRDW